METVNVGKWLGPVTVTSDLEALARRCELLRGPDLDVAEAVASLLALYGGPEAARLAFEAIAELSVTSAHRLLTTYASGWVTFGRTKETKSSPYGPDYRTTLMRAGITVAGRRRKLENFAGGVGHYSATSFVAALIRAIARRELH